MTSLQFPPALRDGDCIAFVSPSSCLASLVPHRLDKAKRFFENRGFRVKIYPSVQRTPDENHAILKTQDPDTHALHHVGYSSADASIQAQDLMDAFLDPEVKAIVCAIGGLTCHELLEYLDFDAIRSHPKIFCGYSDVTSLHIALAAKANLCTFYGPAAVSQFGEFPKPMEYTLKVFFAAVQSTSPLGAILPSSEWTDDKTANWMTKEDIEYEEVYQKNEGYRWIRQGSSQGPILGGCLPTMLNTRGSEFQMDFTDSILLLETPEGIQFDQPIPLDRANACLGCLRLDGTLRNVRGIVIGRCFAYTPDQVEEFIRLIKYHTRGYEYPILYGIDIGHTNPVATIPLGCTGYLDSSNPNAFTIMESGVSAPNK